MKSSSDAASWAILLTALTSLASMVCLHLVDNIVSDTLRNYGLQFSYDWATPYWRLVQIGFILGWINIATALVLQANAIRLKRKAEQPADAIKEAWKTAKSPETEKAHEEKSETEPAKPPEEAPQSKSEPEAQEKKEEPQQPEKTPEQEPQETKPDEIPSLASLYPELPPAQA